MKIGLRLQIASTFACTPIEASLHRSLVDAGTAVELGFARFTQLSEYLLTSAPSSQVTLGTVVLLRLEDWLREQLESTPYDAARDVSIRQEFRLRVEEFVSQLAILARLDKPVWLLACPSNGWISEQHKIEDLCRTYTNLVLARARDLAQVTVVNWPASSTDTHFVDRDADRLGQAPFTQDTFDRLGELLGRQIARDMASQNSTATSSTSRGSSELANYLAGLQVRVELAPADRSHREHIDRMIRTAASFTLMGERPLISDTEVNELVDSGNCMLVNVTDRVSEFGPSGIVAFRSTADELVVRCMALSCPVLGKQVEYAVLSALGHIAAERRLARIALEYQPSGRNQPTLAFLRSIADAETNQRFVLPTDESEARINKAAVAPGAWSMRIVAQLSMG